VVTDQLDALNRLLTDERLGARIVVVDGPDQGITAVLDAETGLLTGALPEPAADIEADAAELMSRGQHRSLGYGTNTVYIESVVPPQVLVIFGAVHIGQALCSLAHHLGYRVTVSDARAAFCTIERFPTAHRLAVGWPDQLDLTFDRRTAVVVLSHDARFEDPLWPQVLNSPVFYIGAMGSKKTAARRRQKLLEAGFATHQVDRIHGPIGIEIGAEQPGEVAVAILAEIIAARTRPSQPLHLRGAPRPI
jgi:xanthine dehydrogenase accessory factor